jgi:hypothetical protein
MKDFQAKISELVEGMNKQAERVEAAKVTALVHHIRISHAGLSEW